MKIKLMKSIGILLIAGLFAVGCASSSQNLAMASANAIGGYTSAEIEVSEVDRGMTRVSWVATTSDGRVFLCEADDMVRKVNAVEKKD